MRFIISWFNICLFTDTENEAAIFLNKNKRATIPPKRIYTDNSENELDEYALKVHQKRAKNAKHSLKAIKEIAGFKNSNYLVKAAYCENQSISNNITKPESATNSNSLIKSSSSEGKRINIII